VIGVPCTRSDDDLHDVICPFGMFSHQGGRAEPRAPQERAFFDRGRWGQCTKRSRLESGFPPKLVASSSRT
jgi:hypothetical protein